MSSQNSLHILQSSHGDQACSQSEALPLSSGQWHFSDLTPPLNLSSNHGAFHMWLCSSSSSSSCRSALMMRLSAVAVKTLADSMRGGACGGPLRPLKDWTAPPSLSIDHRLVGCRVNIRLINIHNKSVKMSAIMFMN